MIDKAKDLLRQVGFSLKGSTYRLPLRTIGPANGRVFMNLLLRKGSGRVLKNDARLLRGHRSILTFDPFCVVFFSDS